MIICDRNIVTLEMYRANVSKYLDLLAGYGLRNILLMLIHEKNEEVTASKEHILNYCNTYVKHSLSSITT